MNDLIRREDAIKQCGWGMTSMLIADCLRRLPSVKPQICEDTISRQEAIDSIIKIHPVDTEYDYILYDKVDVMYVLKNLPPVTPQPKMGRWIVNKYSIYCSECGCGALYDKVYPSESVFGKAIRVKSTFCPTCGAKMD